MARSAANLPFMDDEILDVDQMNPDAWDSKKRVAVSDAIIEVNDHLRKVKLGRYLMICLAIFIVLGTALLRVTALNNTRADVNTAC